VNRIIIISTQKSNHFPSQGRDMIGHG